MSSPNYPMDQGDAELVMMAARAAVYLADLVSLCNSPKIVFESLAEKMAADIDKANFERARPH